MEQHIDNIAKLYCVGEPDIRQDVPVKIINIAIKAKHPVIIGFPDPTLALHILFNNKTCILHCFDGFYSTHSKLCYEYLKDVYKDRIIIHKGDVKITIPMSTIKPDFIAINTNEDPFLVNLEFFMTMEKSLSKPIYIFPINNEKLENFWKGYISNGLITESERVDGFAIGKSTKIDTREANIAVCTLELGEKFKKTVYRGRLTKEMYCLQHGYDLRCDEDIYDNSRPRAWSKIKLLLKCLEEGYDYAVWLDADTLIMNHNITLEDIIKHSQGKDIMVARDNYNFNTGVLFVKNTQWSIDFLNEVYKQTQYIDHGNWEQTAIIHLYDTNAMNSQNHFCVIRDQTLFNSYWFCYDEGQFLLHFAGCWRDDVDNGLTRMMESCYPFRKRSETMDDYKKRLEYQKNIRKIR